MASRKSLLEFAVQFGRTADDIPDSVKKLLAEGDTKAAVEEMIQHLSGAYPRHIPEPETLGAVRKKYLPDGTGTSVRGSPRKAPPPPEPQKASPETPVAGDKSGGFIRSLLSPVTMDVTRASGLPKGPAPQDSFGDAVRKIIGYGVVPGAAVGMAARKLSENEMIPGGRSEPRTLREYLDQQERDGAAAVR